MVAGGEWSSGAHARSQASDASSSHFHYTRVGAHYLRSVEVFVEVGSEEVALVNSVATGAVLVLAHTSLLVLTLKLFHTTSTLT